MPRAFASRTIDRTSSRPTGSSADVGSSSTTSCGISEERDAEPEALLHPLGEAGYAVGATRAQPDRRQGSVDLRRPAMPREAGQFTVQAEDLAGGQPRLIPEQLRQVADAPASLAVPQRPAEDGPAPARGSGEPQEQLHGSRLAGAIGSEEAEDLGLADAQVKAVERDGVAVGLAQAMGFDRGRVHRGICDLTDGHTNGLRKDVDGG